MASIPRIFTMSKTDEQAGAILEDVVQELIDTTEAVRRLVIVETEPGASTCRSCRFFRKDGCYVPGQPPRAEHPDTIRCGRYEERDERLEALPIEAVRPRRVSSKMWKV